MIQIKSSLTILLFILSFGLKAQLGISFSSADVNQGSNGSIDVTVSNFNNLLGFQFSINWDSLVGRYASIANITNSLPGFDMASIQVPGGGSSMRPGQMALVWFSGNGNPQSLPNGTRLFTINLTGIGQPCDSTFVNVTGIPVPIEVIDGNTNIIGLNSTPGKLRINGTNCSGGGGGGNENDLKFTLAHRNVQPGEQICVPVTVDNFINVVGGQGSFNWNPTIIQFLEIRNVALTGFNTNTMNTSQGNISFVWFDADTQPNTLPNGSKLLDICFTAIGTIGQSSVVTMSSSPVEHIWNDQNGADIPFTVVSGSVTIVDQPSDPVTIRVASANANQGSEICLDITADNFVDIVGAQWTITWNPAVLQYTSVRMFELQGMTNANFNPSGNNQLRMQWQKQDGTGQTIPNGGRLFQICFNVIGDCNTTPSSAVNIISIANLPIQLVQLVNNNPVEVAQVDIVAGTVNVNPCGVSCSVVSSKNITCNGGQDGEIIVSISGADTGCNCVWRRNGTVFQTLPLSNCNLVGAPAGTYVLEVTCNGNVACSQERVLTQPNAINIEGVVTNVGCNTTGSIVLTVTGGSGGFTYRWSDNAGGVITKDVANLNPGTYSVTVTDSNNCTNARSFNITDNVQDMTASGSTTNVNCFGGADGSITLNIQNGCPPYNTAWSMTGLSGTSVQNLAAGTYRVTITDSSTPPTTLEREFIITQPASALTVMTAATNSSGADGTVTVTVTGGTPNYTSVWSNSNIPANSFLATGLAPGVYTVTVTDSRGCTATASATVNMTTNVPDPSITSVSVSQQISCFGICNGTIGGVISGGRAPYRINVTGATTVSRDGLPVGPFSIPNICAGSHTILLTDADGKTATTTLMVTQPPRLTATSSIECENGVNEDGAININPQGGTGSYTFSWTPNMETSQNLQGLSAGLYSVLIQDANGCQFLLQNMRVGKCTDGECYSYTSIITPNDDGINDVLNIRCATDFQSDLTIYDRWGNIVFERRNYDNTWAGTRTDGTPLPESAYMFVLTVNFGNGTRENIRGTVTVLRN